MPKVWVILGILIVCVSLVGIAYGELSSEQNATSPGEMNTTSAESSETSVVDAPGSVVSLEEKITELTSFVKKGVVYAKNNSKEDALAVFNDVNGEFVKGEQYLFAYDRNGTTLALPYQQDYIGQNRMNLTDSNGAKIMESLVSLSKYGGGYLYYVYPNPTDNGTEQVKISYVEPVDDSWFIGAGIYLPHINAAFDKEAISGLFSRVEQAAAFGEKEGKESASVVFNDKTTTWAENSAYIFAYDMNGTTLALPYQPEIIGTNRMDYKDKYGSPSVRLDIDTAKAGGGFVYLVYYNPDSGRDELKLCYVLPVDNDWLVGSGLYSGKDLSDINKFL